MQYENLPEEVRQTAKFCCWKAEDGTKRPYDPRTSRFASSNNPDTFTDYGTALRSVEQYNGLGIGVFDRLCAIDIDHCFDPIAGMTDYASDIVQIMHSYTEFSPSGTGIRILFYADTFDKEKYYVHNRKQGIEVYVAGVTQKFVTVTGDYLEGVIGERDAELQIFLDKYMRRVGGASGSGTCGKSILTDEQVKEKAMKLYKFQDLWNGGKGDSPSTSEADQALCVSLAFWTGRDKEQMDRLFRESKRMRPKWDEARGARTYGELTLDNAIAFQTSVYDPSYCTNGSTETREDSLRLEQDFHPFDNPRYAWNDIGAANLFADWYEGVIAYVPEKKKWFTYDGHVWQPGNGEDIEAMNLLKKLACALRAYARKLLAEAQKPEEKSKEKSLEELFMAYVEKWQSRKFRENVLKDARGNAMMSIECFDADPYQLNMLNGVLDLRNGTFHDHRAEDYHTMTANVEYDPTARSVRWERFVDEIMRGDAECSGFIQRALGYSLTGDISKECMFMLYGATTRNGKSTLAGTFARLMGDYAKNCNPASIAQKRGDGGGGGPSEDIARLRGARFVNVSEPDKRMALSTALIKSMTGGNEMTARSLNECSFQFRPQFKIFVDTNYLPTSTDTTLFDSGRVNVIPFNRHFEEDEQDRGLKEELARPENLSGILNWCLEGLRLLNSENGRFRQPAAVRNATSQYREDNDRVAAFLADELDKDGDAEALLTDAYSRYKLWCDARGYRVDNLSSFKTGIEREAPVVKKRPKGTGKGATSVIVGYGLKTGTDAAFQCENER